ncbi:MAG: substrate-binding periplasmic protein [Thalassovita sp.]
MRIAALATLILSLATPVLARDAQEIQLAGLLTVCANRDALPVSSDGDMPGYQLEIAQEMAKRLDVRLQVEWIWAGYQARYTECDMTLGVARDPKPGGYARYLHVLTEVDILLVFHPDTKLETPDDLKGLRVAVPSTTLAHFRLLDLGAQPRVAYRSDSAILTAISTGKVQAGVVSSLALGWFRMQHPDQTFNTRSTDMLGIEARYPLTIALRHMDSLAEADFQELLTQLRDDGTLGRIMARYGQTLSPRFDDPYAKIPDSLSPPQGINVRRDIIQDLQDRVRKQTR